MSILTILTTEQLEQIRQVIALMADEIESAHQDDQDCGLADDGPHWILAEYPIDRLLRAVQAVQDEIKGKQLTSVYTRSDGTGRYAKVEVVVGCKIISEFWIESRRDEGATRARAKNRAVSGWSIGPLAGDELRYCSLAELFGYLHELGADLHPIAALARERGWEEAIIDEALNDHAWLSHSPKSSQAAWAMDQATRALVDLKAIRREGELPDPEWEDRIDEVLAAIKSFKEYGSGDKAEMAQ